MRSIQPFFTLQLFNILLNFPTKVHWNRPQYSVEEHRLNQSSNQNQSKVDSRKFFSNAAFFEVHENHCTWSIRLTIVADEVFSFDCLPEVHVAFLEPRCKQKFNSFEINKSHHWIFHSRNELYFVQNRFDLTLPISLLVLQLNLAEPKKPVCFGFCGLLGKGFQIEHLRP